MNSFLYGSHILVLIVTAGLSAMIFSSVDRSGFKLFAVRWCLGVALLALLAFVLLYTDVLRDLLSGNVRLQRVVSGLPPQVGVIGLTVGVVELVSRYKDNPMRALLTLPALIYIVLNLLACLAMLDVLRVIQPSWLYGTYAGRQLSLYVVLAAGFGAVALFRSSLFKLKTADGETSIGPAVVLDTLLSASDRAVDRVVATPRGSSIAQIMAGISYERARLALPAYCFALMQNVSQQEQKDVGDQVAQLTTSNMDDQVRSLNLGLTLLNIVGNAVLRSAVDALRPFIKTDPTIEQGDTARIGEILRDVDFEKAQVALPVYCFALARTVTGEVQKSFAEQVVAIAQTPVSSRAKTLMLGVALVGVVGFPVTRLAVEHLGRDICA